MFGPKSNYCLKLSIVVLSFNTGNKRESFLFETTKLYLVGEKN